MPGPGRPVKAINWDEVKYLRKLGFSWVKIAEKLNVSRQTLYRRLEGDTDLIGYTVIADQELDSVISAYLINHPNDGERMVIGHLRSREIFVTRYRIRESIHRIDPSGVA